MRVLGNEVKVGDELKVWFNGGRAVVKSLTPYDGPLLKDLGEGTQIAEFAGVTSGMTITANSIYEVLYRIA